MGLTPSFRVAAAGAMAPPGASWEPVRSFSLARVASMVRLEVVDLGFARGEDLNNGKTTGIILFLTLEAADEPLSISLCQRDRCLVLWPWDCFIQGLPPKHIK